MDPIDNEPISPLLQNMEAVEADDLLDEANQKAQAEAVHARISDAKELKVRGTFTCFLFKVDSDLLPGHLFFLRKGSNSKCQNWPS